MSHLKLIQAFVVLCLLCLVTVACVYDPMRYNRQSQVNESFTESDYESDYYEPWGYFYYPDTQVYYHYSSGYYYYIADDGVWVWARVLPPRYRLNPRARVKLYIENDRPFLFHHQHIQRYRPDRRYPSTPQLDRRERDRNRDWHDRQRRIKDRDHITSPPRTTRPTPQVDRREREKDRDKRRKDQQDEHDNQRDDQRDDQGKRRQPQPDAKEPIEVIPLPGTTRVTPHDSRSREEGRQHPPRPASPVDHSERDDRHNKNHDRHQQQAETKKQKRAGSRPGLTRPIPRTRREQDESRASQVTPGPVNKQSRKAKPEAGNQKKSKHRTQQTKKQLKQKDKKKQIKQKDKKSKAQEQDEEQGEQEDKHDKSSKKHHRDRDEDRRRN